MAPRAPEETKVGHFSTYGNFMTMPQSPSSTSSSVMLLKTKIKNMRSHISNLERQLSKNKSPGPSPEPGEGSERGVGGHGGGRVGGVGRRGVGRGHRGSSKHPISIFLKKKNLLICGRKRIHGTWPCSPCRRPRLDPLRRPWLPPNPPFSSSLRQRCLPLLPLLPPPAGSRTRSGSSCPRCCPRTGRRRSGICTFEKYILKHIRFSLPQKTKMCDWLVRILSTFLLKGKVAQGQNPEQKKSWTYARQTLVRRTEKK